MKRSKKILISVLSIIIVFFLFAAWYQYEYSMDKVSPFQINSPETSQKLLIATQGSAFKDAINSNIINYYQDNQAIYIKVIDVEGLDDVKPENFNALVIMHTWESWKAPMPVEKFIRRLGENQEKIVVLTTSGSGTYKMKEVDALTGESKLESVDYFTDQIIKKLDPLLKQ